MGRVSHQVAAAQEAAAFFGARVAMYTTPEDVMADLKAGDKDFVLLDARHELQFVHAHLPGAQNLGPAAIDDATAKHFLPDRDRLVVCYGDDVAAELAAARLAQLGYSVKVMLGGMRAWRDANFKAEGIQS